MAEHDDLLPPAEALQPDSAMLAAPDSPAPAMAPGADASDISTFIRMNPLAIVSFVGSFIIGLVGIICGAIALKQVKRTRERGRGFALAGIIIGATNLLLGIVLGAVYATVVLAVANGDELFPTSDSPGVTASEYGDDAVLDALWDDCEAGDYTACDDLFDDSGAGTAYEDFGWTCGGRTDGYACDDLAEGSATDVEPDPNSTAGQPAVALDDLLVGDCYLRGAEAVTGFVNVLDCSQLHNAEVFHVYEMTDGAFPGDDQLEQEATTECLGSFESYVGSTYDASSAEASYLAPSEETWAKGDRGVICLLTTSGMGSLRNSVK
jgi:hypothetical protein